MAVAPSPTPARDIAAANSSGPASWEGGGGSGAMGSCGPPRGAAAGVGRAAPAGWDAFLERMDECRGVLAALLSAGPESIALTHSTTDGMNIATWGVDWRPGDRALTTNAEPPGLLGPLVAVRDRAGVALDIVDVEGGGDPALIQERIAAAMTPRTRLVSLSHVLWTTGAVLPVVEIGRIARERGVWYAVDAAQSAGAILVDAEAIGADFIAFPGQKWLLGPEGAGARGAAPRAGAEGAPAAAVPGVTLVTPQERMATLVSFRVQGWTPLELREELSRRVFAITRTVAAVDGPRISGRFFKSEGRRALVMLPSDGAPGA